MLFFFFSLPKYIWAFIILERRSHGCDVFCLRDINVTYHISRLLKVYYPGILSTTILLPVQARIGPININVICHLSFVIVYYSDVTVRLGLDTAAWGSVFFGSGLEKSQAQALGRIVLGLGLASA